MYPDKVEANQAKDIVISDRTNDKHYKNKSQVVINQHQKIV